MSLAVYGHLFSSYTQKVFMALYENGTPFEFRALGQEAPEHVGEWLKRWPVGKFPVLVDGDRTVVETSIIIEYLQLTHAGPVRLIPADPMTALDVRFLDRFFDLHVMNMMQLAVDGALTGDVTKRKDGHDAAIEKLDRAYAWLEGELVGRTWAIGAECTMADCAAAPAMFYANIVSPFGGTHRNAAAYLDRLMKRPSVARTVEEAKPYVALLPK